MVTKIPGELRVGAAVRVPWGIERYVDGTIVEVWGDPPAHVRVQLQLDDRDDEDGPVVVLLSPSMVTAA